jgi:hypothetical protein
MKQQSQTRIAAVRTLACGLLLTQRHLATPLIHRKEADENHDEGHQNVACGQVGWQRNDGWKVADAADLPQRIKRNN